MGDSITKKTNKQQEKTREQTKTPLSLRNHHAPLEKSRVLRFMMEVNRPVLLVSLVCIHSSKSSEGQQPYNTKMTIFHNNSVHRRPCCIGSEVPNAGHVDRAVYITKDVERDDNPVNRSIVCHDIETDTLLCLLVRTYKTLCHSKSYYR